MAEELAAPLSQQLLEMFGPNVQGSPGDINRPELVLAVVHRLAQDNAPRIDFLQVGEAAQLAGCAVVQVQQWFPTLRQSMQ